MKKRLREFVTPLALSAFGVGCLLASSSAANSQQASRYPYDPVCSYGRVANGKGMLVRCLTPEEAASLLKGKPPPAAPPPAAATTAAPEAASGAVEARIAAVQVDEGKLPAAEKKLSLARDRFATCVVTHGGLTSPEGEVHVRFLVRARGRAEGVSVAKRVAVSADAARCIADVVDRRWVGTPEAPLVGATAVVKVSKVKK